MLHFNILINALDGKCKAFEFGVSKDTYNRIAMMSTVNNGANILTSPNDGIIDKGDMIKVATLDFESVVNITGKKEVDLVKCDIEGAEFEVFINCKRSLLRKVKCYIMEIHVNKDDIKGMYNLRLLAETFEKGGFKIMQSGPIMLFIRDDIYGKK